MAVISKKIMEQTISTHCTYVMYENYYSSGRTNTYSIRKICDNNVENVVKDVRKSTANAVWKDIVIDRWVY